MCNDYMPYQAALTASGLKFLSFYLSTWVTSRQTSLTAVNY